MQIDSETLDSFFEGLPPEYRAEIRYEGYRNLQEAYNKAVIVSKRLERDRFRTRDSRPPPRTNFSNPPVTSNNPSRIATHNQPQPSSSTSDPTFQNKICGYCKKIGHLISECRRRAGSDSARCDSTHPDSTHQIDTNAR